MMLDAFNTFSQDQTINAASVVSDSKVDTRYKNIGEGSPVYLYMHVNTEFTGSGSLNVQLETKEEDGDAWETVLDIGPLDAAALKQGKDTRVSIPPGTGRQFQVRYIKNGTLSNGSVYSGLRWQ